MPFASLYIDAPPGSLVAQRIRNTLISDKNTRLAASAAEAEAVLKIGQEERTKTILSLSGAGRVTEYRLALHLSYSVSGREERILAEPENIELVRDMTYDDAQLLAKGAEEQLAVSRHGRQRGKADRAPSAKHQTRKRNFLNIPADRLPDQLARGLAPLYVVVGDEPLAAQEAGDAIRAAARAAGPQRTHRLHRAGTLQLAGHFCQRRQLFRCSPSAA